MNCKLKYLLFFLFINLNTGRYLQIVIHIFTSNLPSLSSLFHLIVFTFILPRFKSSKSNVLTKSNVPKETQCRKPVIPHFMSTTETYYEGLDAYQILNVPKSSDKDAIKSAYRKLVAKWHPDKFPDDVVMKKQGGLRMEKINRAYYVLSDEDRRRRYDQYGEQGVGSSAASEEQLKASGGPGRMGGFGGQGGGSVDVQDISDIFDAFFGGRAAAGGGSGGFGGGRKAKNNMNAPVAGDDIQVDVEISFMTALFGGQEKIRVRRLEECGTCTGSGIKPGAKIRSCSVCEGQGVVSNMQRTPFGVFNNVQNCPNCRGSGQEIEDYCPTCKGKGANPETKEVSLKIPKGVEPGMIIFINSFI